MQAFLHKRRYEVHATQQEIKNLSEGLERYDCDGVSRSDYSSCFKYQWWNKYSDSTLVKYKYHTDKYALHVKVLSAKEGT